MQKRQLILIVDSIEKNPNPKLKRDKTRKKNIE
jgi:hypothetical protein